VIDDEDVDFAILVWPSGGWLMSLLGIVVFVVLAWFAWHNDADCQQRACPGGGAAKLLDHECVCVTEPANR
jgi:hypothetical protein